MTRPGPHEDDRHERALQLASRFTALVRSARAYPVGHATFRHLLDDYLVSLAPALEEHGSVRFDAPEGELRVNGAPVPFRPQTQKAVEVLAHEIAARGIEGIEFRKGIDLLELEGFMSFFLSSERGSGAELVATCDDAGLVNARALPLRHPAPAPDAAADAALPADTLGAAEAPWRALLSGAQALLEGDALDRGIELRHVKRLVQPLADAVLAGEHVVATLAQVGPRASAWSHAAHTAIAALCVGARLGLSRHDLADVGVAALLHDAGHGWSDAGPEVDEHREPPAHAREGLRRVAWSTTLNATSLGVMRTALEHHEPGLGDPDGQPTALLTQLVSIADAYVTLLSRGRTREARLSPTGALVRVVGPLRGHWHPALPAALVRALGVHPPGQVVELDDGSLARAVAPDAQEPERPWVALLSDARQGFVPAPERRAMPLPAERYVVRALPRADWPRDAAEEQAA